MAEKKNNNRKITVRFNIMWFWSIIALLIIGTWIFGTENTEPVKSNWNTVETMIRNGEVDKIVVVNGELAEVYLQKGVAARYRDSEDKELQRMPQTGAQITFIIGSVDSFENNLHAVENESGYNVVLEYDRRGDGWTTILVNLVPWLFLIGIFVLMMRNLSRGAGGAGGGIMNVGKAKAQVFDKENSKRVTFKDVAGLEEAKVEIMEIVDFLKKKDKYVELGAKIPKGALLVGPPGTGKTLLAKAVAGEANVPFLSISGSDFVEMFVGVGASRVRDLFEQAKQKAPCILFIDEIDAIGLSLIHISEPTRPY